MKMEIFGGFGVKPESRELQNRLAIFWGIFRTLVYLIILSNSPFCVFDWFGTRFLRLCVVNVESS
jgi:hypothetical protein